MQDVVAPSIVREPLMLGNVPIPSRFFLAPLAGYTSLAFRLAVRECGGLGLATTDLVNARSILERRRRSFELAETCPARSAAVDPDLRARDLRDAGGRALGRRPGGLGRRHQHGLPGQQGGQDRRRLGPDVPGRLGDRAGRGGRERGRRPGHGQDAARLGRGQPDGPGAGARVRAGRRGRRHHPRPDPRAGVPGERRSRGDPRGGRGRRADSRSSATATSAPWPTPPRCSARPAARRSRSAAGPSRTRSSSASSPTGPSTATPAPSRPSRIAST